MTKTIRINFKQINELTADNMHTEALWVLAKNLRNNKWMGTLEQASNTQQEIGYITPAIKQTRIEARTELLAQVLEKLGTATYMKVCQSV